MHLVNMTHAELVRLRGLTWPPPACAAVLTLLGTELHVAHRGGLQVSPVYLCPTCALVLVAAGEIGLHAWPFVESVTVRRRRRRPRTGGTRP